MSLTWKQHMKRSSFALAVVLLVTFILPEVHAQSAMPAYQIDQATAEIVRLLLDANIVQWMIIWSIMFPLGLMGYVGVSVWRAQRERRFEASRREREDQADDKIINRILDMTDAANKNTSALTVAIEGLTAAQRDASIQNERTEREHIAIRQANRESILAGTEATAQLSIHVQELGRQTLSWSKLMDENMTLVREEIKGVRVELQSLQKAVQSPPLRGELSKLFREVGRDILHKLDEILRKLDNQPTPPTEPDDRAPDKKITPLDADGAKNGESEQDAA